MSTNANKDIKLQIGVKYQTFQGHSAHVLAKMSPDLCREDHAPYVVAVEMGPEADPPITFVQYFENGLPGQGDWELQRLFEYNPLTALQLNEPVQASITGRGRLKWYHFAGFEDGVPYVWEDGKTSYTAKRSVPVKSIRVPDWKK